MPDLQMIRSCKDIDLACAIYRSNWYFTARNVIFSRHPLLKAKRAEAYR